MKPTRKYDDIMEKPRPVSERHPPMPLRERAAQFAPFAALNGYDAQIREAGRQTQQALELTESSIQYLDGQLRYLNDHGQAEATVTWFQPDPRKTGGSYVTHSGRVKKVDVHRQLLLLQDGTAIALHTILRIECAVCP